jgi:hypothetical protein
VRTAPAELVAEVERWRAEPLYFASAVLGIDTLWKRQREILESVRDNRRTAVPSCHESGKSLCASVVVLWWLLSRQPSRIVTTAPTTRQVRDILWAEIRARHAGMVRKLGGDPGLGAPNLTSWEISAGWDAVGFATAAGAGDESAHRFSGYHGDVLVVLDEAGGVPRETWIAAEGLMSGPRVRMLAIGQPASGGEFERVCRSPDWRVIRISAFDCPNLQPDAPPATWGVTREWVEQMRRRFGEGSVVYLSKVLGLFPTSSDDALLSLKDVETALGRMPSNDAKAKQERASIGVDVARFGTDETVAYVVRGPRVVAVESHAGQNLMATAGMTIRLAREHGIEPTDAGRIAIDDTGLGGGVTDRLRELGWRVRAVNFGSAPERQRNEVKFRNRRTELWWTLRDWIRGEAALAELSDDAKDVLRADLCAPRYEQLSDGRIALESKDEIKKRVGRSPDHADALALALLGRRRAMHETATSEQTARPKLSPEDAADERSDWEEDAAIAAEAQDRRRFGPLHLSGPNPFERGQ